MSYRSEKDSSLPPDYVFDFAPQGWKARAGEWAFRRRTLLPLLLLPALAVGDREFSWPLLIGAVALFALGEGLRIWAVSYAHRVTRTRSRRLACLVTSGPFARVRNPIYLGNIANAVATALLFGRLDLAPWVFIVTLGYYDVIVAFEEQLLQHRFGSEYDQYRRRVPRWRPRWSAAKEGDETQHRPNLREALFSERGTYGTLALLWLSALLTWFYTQ
jgi:protein-S-isoprenylcysteine O-methyltransferase Ste14